MMSTTLKDSNGEELVVMAVLVSIEMSKGLDGDSVLAISDFVSVIAQSLIAIADRRTYKEQQLLASTKKQTSS